MMWKYKPLLVKTTLFSRPILAAAPTERAWRRKEASCVSS